MKNSFIQSPRAVAGASLSQYFCLTEGYTQLSREDMESVTLDAENLILLEGRAVGQFCLNSALQAAIRNAESVADGHNLFSANKVCVLVANSEAHPLSMIEFCTKSAFEKSFRPGTAFVWGLETAKGDDDGMIVRIMAANLKPDIEMSLCDDDYYSPTDWERHPGESDEDYRERIQDQEDYAESFD